MDDGAVHDSISYYRFLQIKCTYKLCNNYSSAKKGNPNYNPAYKYDLILKSLVHSCNAMSKSADYDLCGDETTLSHMGYG